MQTHEEMLEEIVQDILDTYVHQCVHCDFICVSSYEELPEQCPGCGHISLFETY